MTQNQIGALILRLSMAGVYLYFGFSQLMDTDRWVSIVPDWAINLLPMSADMMVMANGGMEVVLGALLALGLLVRPIAIILAIHLFVIAWGFGLTPLGIRDFGLAFATLALAFTDRE